MWHLKNLTTHCCNVPHNLTEVTTVFRWSLGLIKMYLKINLMQHTTECDISRIWSHTVVTYDVVWKSYDSVCLIIQSYKMGECILRWLIVRAQWAGVIHCALKAHQMMFCNRWLVKKPSVKNVKYAVFNPVC